MEMYHIKKSIGIQEKNSIKTYWYRIKSSETQ